MKRKLVLVQALVLVFCLPLAAAAIEVAEAVISAGVSERRPAEVAEKFPATVGKLYCFTRITGAEGDTTVTHVWVRAGEEMARVELPVAAGNWRTWSSKRILSQWSGSWRVDILDAGGRVLAQLPFTIEEP